MSREGECAPLYSITLDSVFPPAFRKFEQLPLRGEVQYVTTTGSTSAAKLKTRSTMTTAGTAGSASHYNGGIMPTSIRDVPEVSIQGDLGR